MSAPAGHPARGVHLCRGDAARETPQQVSRKMGAWLWGRPFCSVADSLGQVTHPLDPVFSSAKRV